MSSSDQPYSPFIALPRSHGVRHRAGSVVHFVTQLHISEPIGGGRCIVAAQPVPQLLRDLLLSRRAGLRALVPEASTGEVVALLVDRGLKRRSDRPTFPLDNR